MTELARARSASGRPRRPTAARPRVCLVTTGQPSTNPRLVKEADALYEAGCDVRVVCAQWSRWAAEADRATLSTRGWACRQVGGDPDERRLAYWLTRVRHRAARALVGVVPGSRLLQERAVARPVPELARAAVRERADLYVAHNLGALPAAAAAARRHGVPLGFDAEDFHSGSREHGREPTPVDRAIQAIEARFLPACDYVTAASPGIAEAYARAYRLEPPRVVLNVFPLAQRPERFRDTAPDGPLTLHWFSQTIGAQRGLEDVVAALGRARDLDVRLHLRGEWQPGFAERIAELCGEQGVAVGRVVAHAPAPPDRVIALAGAFDVGLAVEQPVSDNRDLCLTNKIFTYLLAGCAVLATETRGQAEVVRDLAPAARGCPPGDVDALAHAIRGWDRDRAQLDRARRRAWELGQSRYNWDIEKRGFLSVLRPFLPALA